MVAGVYEALCLVEDCVKVDRLRLAPELRDYAKGAFPGAPVLNFQVGAGRPRGDGNDAFLPAKGAGGVLHGDFRRVACGNAALDQKPLQRIFLPYVRDETLAVALGAACHRAAAHHYDVGV